MKKRYYITGLLLMLGAALNNNVVARDMVVPQRMGDFVEVDTSAAVCDSILWRGRWLTTSGVYTDTVLSSSLGDDSVYVLNLTVHHSSSVVENVIICDRYLWNGVVYTSSTDEPFVVLHAATATPGMGVPTPPAPALPSIMDRTR